MPDRESLIDYLTRKGIDSFLPHVSINCVVFAYDHPSLKVLVSRRNEKSFLSIPGGYVKKGESLDDAAYRNLKRKGIENVFLTQIKTFGDVERVQYPKNHPGRTKDNQEAFDWIFQRFISVTYYGVVLYSSTKISNPGNYPEVRWLDTRNIERMIFDHASIVEETLKKMKQELLNLPIASKLLPEYFTLNELRGLFEVILNREIDRGTFRRKMLSLGIIEQGDEQKDTKGRPAYLYRFNQEVYQRFLTEETKFGF